MTGSEDASLTPLHIIATPDGCRSARWSESFDHVRFDSYSCQKHPERLALALASIAWPDHVAAFSVADELLLCKLRLTSNYYLPVQALTPTRFAWPTKEDIDNGLLFTFVTREEMDCVHGAGSWRSIVRFALTQTAGGLMKIPTPHKPHFSSRTRFLKLHSQQHLLVKTLAFFQPTAVRVSAL